MVKAGQRLFTPPVFAQDEKNQAVKLIYPILWIQIVSIAVIAIVLSFLVPAFIRYWLVFAFFTIVIGLALLQLARSGQTFLSSLLLVAELWALLAFFAWTAAGIGARAAWGYFIVVFIAGMLLGRTAGMITAGICSLSTLAIAFLSPVVSPHPLQFWLTNSMYLVFVIFLQFLASRSIRESLQAAKQQLFERLQAEEALRISEERFKLLSSLTSEGIMVHAGGIILDANQVFAELAGYANSDDLIGKIGMEIISFTAGSRQRIIDSLRTGSTATFEVELVKPDGSILPAETHSKEIIYRGRQAGLVSMRDITERKLGEAKLLESERRYRALFEAADYGILLLHGTHFIDCNVKILELFGCTREQIANVLQAQLSPEKQPDGCNSHEKAMEKYSAALAGCPQRFDWIYLKSDGTPFPAEVSLNSVELSSGTHLLAMVRDITERKLGEAKLLESERRYRTLFESAGDAIFLLQESRIIDCNSRTLEVFGCSREQIVGLPISRFHPLLQPDGSDSLLKGKEKNTTALGGESQFFQWRHIRFDGTLFDAEVNLNRVELSSGMHVLAIVRDITNHKILEEQLRQAQKMEAVGILAGGVAHDFNNILSTIVGYASLLQMHVGPEVKLKEYLERILASTERAASLTHSLLAFSRKQAIELQPVDINESIFGFHKVLARLIGEDIDFTLHLASESLVVNADIRQIEQVLMNLATNARDAMPHGGKLTISSRSVVLSADHGEIPGGSYAVITVFDSGTGIDKNIQGHLFEPFFTTKEVGKGTGLGLAIVYGIIKNHLGFIKLESEPAQGTTFHIYLPLNPLAVAKDRHRQQPRISRGNETILLVEDDAAVRHVTRSLLEEFGYMVLEAADGQEALAVFAKHRDQVHLLLSDLIMPKKNGKETSAEIMKLNPNIKTIFMSGYTSDIIARKGILEPGTHLLVKPLHPAALLEKIREVLDS